jgi:hypothetical protein
MSARQPSTRLRCTTVLLGSLMTLACNDVVPSVYTARAYEPETMCLDDYTPIGLVDTGTLSSLCPPTCLAVGAALYVSTACPPFPAEATEVEPAKSPDCVQALALLKADKTCD